MFVNISLSLLILCNFSVGISFARLLTGGESPVIKNIMSFQYGKVLIMILLKFMIQSYVLSMVFKSFIYKFVSKEFFHFLVPKILILMYFCTIWAFKERESLVN